MDLRQQIKNQIIDLENGDLERDEFITVIRAIVEGERYEIRAEEKCPSCNRTVEGSAMITRNQSPFTISYHCNCKTVFSRVYWG